ncbi:MAG TPA: phospholipase D-like domain-containing protein [Spirochaetota bacterium]|nr:phospholipase D-like domain-containing protein [Spirochaetota bacterium]HPF06806.1 phospholipase D-like domain-containing protein [Spirochaetota bacterium]HPJ43146.1 phospholipase D-like domain-containing protein [Spirochaetota bacterium]HPR36399.1 phospholipase D-like domain-containing protein [Spirochaetota bacterium]HRX47999.1 phospholipase D-like domain-containing protein [Spirochaetota bacterium]
MKKYIFFLLTILFMSSPGAAEKIEVCFSDPERIRKSIPKPEESFIKLINSSGQEINGAFYDISSMRVAQAFINAAKRGVKVRLVTDSDNLSGKPIESIIDAGIPVVEDNRPGLMHNKFAVIDSSIVYTGSTNATDNCAFKNNNNSVIIRSPELADIYNAEFEEMFSHGVFGNRSDVIPFAPLLNKYYVKIDDVHINAYFSPENNVEKIIKSRLNKAKSSIRFMAFSFTSDVIAETMISKFKEGITVEGVFEKKGSNSEHSEFTKMMIEGLPVVKDRNRKIMHHKVIIIDEKIVITGSFNFSKNANRKNDENILVIESREIAAKYLEEFKRIYSRGRR